MLVSIMGGAFGAVALDWIIAGKCSFDRDGTETSAGLFVDLGAWQFHLLAIRPSSGLA